MDDFESESSLESDYSFECPYCGETISIKVDFAGGRRQVFVYDCEACCQPIVIHLELDQGAVLSFDAQRES